MGNSPSALKQQKLKDAPLALVKKPDGERPLRMHQSLDSITSNTFGSTTRTAPIRERNHHKALPRSKSHEVLTFWPGHLEENYIFEELFNQIDAAMTFQKYKVKHLIADLDIQRNILAGVCQKDGFITKKRVGVRRRDPVSILPASICSGELADLSNRGIIALTSNLGRLRCLVTLNLQGNRLTCLPQEIGLLKNLKELNLSENRLDSLPNTIGFLIRVTELNLRGNELATLPESLGALQRLKVLNISQNKFRIVPTCVGNLTKLCVFEAERNMIEYLPGEMSLLKQLRRIQLYGNPLVKDEYILSKSKMASTGTGVYNLLEAAGRNIVREDLEILRHMPTPLNLFLKSAKKCSFCHGPYFHSHYGRIRLLERQEQTIPFMYLLCSSHWEDEKGRMRVMFETPPQTTPKVMVTNARRTGNTLGAATVNQRSRTATAEHIRISQLLNEPNFPEMPQYYPLTLERTANTVASSSFNGSLMDVRQLPEALDHSSEIAVERNWLDMHTEILSHP